MNVAIQNDIASFVKQPFPDDLLVMDDYHGVTLRLDRTVNDVKPQQEESNDEGGWSFHQNLKDALSLWRMEKKRGIWVHVPQHMAFVVPHCIDVGFSFHSVQEPNLLVLCQWLPTDAPSRLPRGPSHQVGVGILILSSSSSSSSSLAPSLSSNVPTVSATVSASDPTANESNAATQSSRSSSSILVVQERTGPAARRKLWKIPTGLVDPGEELEEAAIRELKEETGLDGIFEGILCVRHAPQGSAGRSVPDLFFVVKVKLLLAGDDDENHQHGGRSEQYQAVTTANSKLQANDEIAEMRWMPVTQYCNQEAWQKSPVYQQINQTLLDYVVEQPIVPSHGLDHQPYGNRNSSLWKPYRHPVGYMPGTNTVFVPESKSEKV